MLIRCWVASWVAFIILLPDASLKTLGNTYVISPYLNDYSSLNAASCRAFFTILASLMVPPNMPLQLFIFVSDSASLGMFFGIRW